MADGGEEIGDWLLRSIVRAVNRQHLELPITLFVGGTIVSGYIRGAAKHYRGVGQEFGVVSQGREDAVAGEKLQAMFHRVAADSEPMADEDEPLHDDYVHLRDAVIVAAGLPSIPSNRGLQWRGRIEAVDAWAFGTLDTRQT